MRRELHAEWTKLRTLPGTGWLLLATILPTIALGALSAGVSVAATCPWAGCLQDPARISLAGVQLGQAAVAMLAVLAVCGEYSSGMIRTTFTAMPYRAGVLAAKAAVLTALTLAAGSVAVLGSVVGGRLLLPEGGFTPARGYALLSPADGPTLRAAAGSVLYLALIALLSLGIAVAVREPAAAAGIVLGLLYLPLLGRLLGDPDWQRLLLQVAPMDAGLAIQITADLAHRPISPWAGLGVLAAWAAAALVGGGRLLRARDA